MLKGKRRMQSTGILLVGWLVILAHCGGHGGGTGQGTGPSGIAVTLTPIGSACSYLNTGGRVMLAAAVTGTTNTALSWAVDGVAGGNSTVGTLVVNGNFQTYTAPATAGVHTISATSAADSTQAASVKLIVLAGTCTPPALAATIFDVTAAPYNAVGNGVADDTAAIVSAIKAASGTQGTVYFPPGTFSINPTYSGQTMVWVGSDTNINLSAGATLQCASTTTSHYSVFLIENVENVHIYGGGAIIGNVANNAIPAGGGVGGSNEDGFGIMVEGAQHVSIEGISVSQFYADGLYVGGVNSTADVQIFNVSSSANRRNALSITAGSGILVRASRFSASTGSIEAGVMANGAGIDVEPNANDIITNLEILDSLFASNRAVGLGAGCPVGRAGASTTNLILDGNTVVGNGGQGIEIEGSGYQISNNLVMNSNDAGIYLEPESNGNLVTGNTVAGTLPDSSPGGDPGYGILLYETAGNTVTGNTLIDNSGLAVRDAYPSASPSTNAVSPNLTAPVTVLLAPAATTLAAGGTCTLLATTAGSTWVTWAVDGVANGNATVGTLAGSGLGAVYTAPAAAGIHTVTATSIIDPTVSASAVLTIQ
jgi:parallel beta-helix repeat protein